MESINEPAFQLTGLKLQNRTSNENGQSSIDCGRLWQKFEVEKIAERIPGRLSDDLYAVYFDYVGDAAETFSYFIGCKVKMGSELPEGMLSLQVPQQQYVKMLAKGVMPDCIADSWKEILSSAANRAYQYDFEVYGESSKDWNDAEVEIFISCV